MGRKRDPFRDAYRRSERARDQAASEYRRQMADEEAGYGTIGSRSMYYDTNPDGSTNVFPDGMPSDHHSRSPHDKMIVEHDGTVSYNREGDDVITDDRG